MIRGIAGLSAPSLDDIRWIDADGSERAPLALSELGAGFKLLFFFQHWCRGCHAHGFPTLVALTRSLARSPVGFAAVQTVFERADENGFERLRENQVKYELNIPFGHAAATPGKHVPAVMEAYRTGGTPWFVVIAPDGAVVHDGFELHADILAQTLSALASGDAAETK
ncbi:peroxiredoxin family protein [Sphingopyxis sp. EG6]|jgi:hypothetical protein|uniref:peroxiredoxin family protein n=1 Tax=Sphingopyxis sp. EG6 TaxID=1874061 RepID=UPI000DC619C4|nr:TlpA family protein disulfide reductase [Sphingopyxis sp. EG6]BBB08697.1 hypothetical protein SPYCW_1713 [Sphingopyxis sp. EG6]